MPSIDYIRNAILRYYSEGTDIWQKAYTGNATAQELYDAFNYLPQVKVDKGISGNTIGVSYAEPMSAIDAEIEQAIINSINSNGNGGSYGNGRGFTGNIPANFGYDSSTGQYHIQSGSKSSLGATLSTVADRTSLAVTGVNIGCKLGKFIDQTLYDLAPDFWDSHLPGINPETWNKLCGQSEIGDYFLRVLFDVTPDGTTGYISEEVLAYYYQMLRDGGLWNEGDKEIIVDPSAFGQLTYTWSNININTNIPLGYWRYGVPSACTYKTVTTSDNIVIGYLYYTSPNTIYIVAASNSPGSFRINEVSMSTGETTSSSTVTLDYDQTVDGYIGTALLVNNVTFYPTIADVTQNTGRGYFVVGSPNTFMQTSAQSLTGAARDWYIIVNNSEIVEQSSIEGFSNIPDSTQYPPTNITGTTTQQVLNELKQQYPDLFTDSITETTLQDDGTLDETTYVPIPWAVTDIRDDTATTTETATQDDLLVDPQTMEKIIEDNPGPTTPDTGDGNGPTPVIPVGQASSLWAVYHPSQSILNSFGAWLWSSDLVEQIKRLFFDPMQGVIGVHKVFSPVPTGGSQNIKVGYIDSGISCPTVSSQYTQVDCGTVSVDEFFGNVFDYEPFTQISAYLPFIGVVKLSTSDVMRSKVNITYGVDVITGACLAKIKITRDGNGGILYSFGGSCAVHYPLSSGSYGGIISGIVSAAVGIGTSVMTGNPLAAVGGVVAGINQAHLDVAKSGGFTGASGATGPKKPYLIISRPQIAMARNFDVMTGYPANNTVQVKDCEGFIKCKETHIESATATKDEVTMIESMLKNGILI